MLNRLLIIMMISLASPLAMACNWVNPTDGVTRYLECQSNWRGFITEPAVTKRMIEIAASYARGEAEKFANLEMVPRQLMTVDAADQIHADYRGANELIDAVNHRIRRESAMQDDLDPWHSEVFRRSLPVGLFAGFSYSSKTLPFADQVLKLVNMTSGASITFAMVMMPKKIVLVKDVNTGQILHLKDLTVTKSEDDATPVALTDSSFMAESAKQYTEEGALRRFDIDFRPMIIVAADVAPGVDAGKKSDAHFNMGMVWGDQIVSTHQLMGAGLSGSIPAKSSSVIKNVPGIVPAPVKFLLTGLGAHKMGVDTLKWGTTVGSAQDAFDNKIDTNGIVTFKPATYLWFRWSLTGGKGVKGNNAADEARQTADTFNISEYRANGFVAMGGFSDGETDSQLNGPKLVGDAEKQGLVGYALTQSFVGIKSVIYPEDEKVEDDDDREEEEEEKEKEEAEEEEAEQGDAE